MMSFLSSLERETVNFLAQFFAAGNFVKVGSTRVISFIKEKVFSVEQIKLKPLIGLFPRAL